MRMLTIGSLAMGLSSMAVATNIPAPPPVAKGTAPAAMLESLLTHSRETARIENGRLTGKGADLLRALSAESQFVLLGEAHGNRGIAEFATALWRDLAPMGFDHGVLEADPWTVASLEQQLRAGGTSAWASHLAANGNAVAVPFYSWKPEADWADAIVRASKAGSPALWGVDQLFIGAAGPMLAQIGRTAKSADARAQANALAAQATDLNWLGTSDARGLQSLKDALSGQDDAGHRAIVEAMLESQAIYRPFSSDSGEPWEANNAREQLMRQLFLQAYRRAEAAGGKSPRAMVKLGAYHAHRGATPTMVQGFGGFLNEFAAIGGGKTLSILLLCGPGAKTSQFIGPETDCMDDEYAKAWSFIAPHLAQGDTTIFDLRSWRLRPARWAHLPVNVQRAIASFDLLVIPAATSGSALLPGLTQPAVPQKP